MRTFKTSDKYRVQTRYVNPPPVAAHSGRSHRWVDTSAHPTRGDANKVRQPHQRVIKICTPSEGALCMDVQAYQGRRFNIITDHDK